MGRAWEAHDDNGICDICGKAGFVWDIYGDLICPRCADEAIRKEAPHGDADNEEE